MIMKLSSEAIAAYGVSQRQSEEAKPQGQQNHVQHRLLRIFERGNNRLPAARDLPTAAYFFDWGASTPG